MLFVPGVFHNSDELFKSRHSSDVFGWRVPLSPGAARLLASLIECLYMEEASEALDWALTTARRVMNKAA